MHELTEEIEDWKPHITQRLIPRVSVGEADHIVIPLAILTTGHHAILKVQATVQNELGIPSHLSAQAVDAIWTTLEYIIASAGSQSNKNLTLRRDVHGNSQAELSVVVVSANRAGRP